MAYDNIVKRDLENCGNGLNKTVGDDDMSEKDIFENLVRNIDISGAGETDFGELVEHDLMENYYAKEMGLLSDITIDDEIYINVDDDDDINLEDSGNTNELGKINYLQNIPRQPGKVSDVLNMMVHIDDSIAEYRYDNKLEQYYASIYRGLVVISKHILVKMIYLFLFINAKHPKIKANFNKVVDFSQIPNIAYHTCVTNILFMTSLLATYKARRFTESEVKDVLFSCINNPSVGKFVVSAFVLLLQDNTDNETKTFEKLVWDTANYSVKFLKKFKKAGNNKSDFIQCVEALANEEEYYNSVFANLIQWRLIDRFNENTIKFDANINETDFEGLR